MERGQAAHQRETHAEPFLDALRQPVGLRERLEDAPEHLGPDPDAVVPDAHHRLPVVARDRQVDVTGPGRVLGRVAQQVEEDLLQTRGIGFQHDRIRRQR